MAVAAEVGVHLRLALALLLAWTAQAATTFYVTVAGVGGEPEYAQRFEGWAKDLGKLLSNAPGGKSTVLFGENGTKAKLVAAIDGIANEAQAGDSVVVMLIGHGTFDGAEYKFNLTGPDLTAGELAAQLDRVKAQRQLVVNMTSASGGSLAALQRPNRAVITATKSGTEKNATIFARHWVESLRDPEADTDKNDTVSALEAFRYAERKTTQFYETQKRIATEHALLEDTGKGEGTRQPSAENGQGLLAGRFPLFALKAAGSIATDPAKRALAQKKQELEQAIDQLRYQKAALATADYRRRLNALLLELAQVQEKLDK